MKMSIGTLSASYNVSWLTVEADANGEMWYDTKLSNERISVLEWFNKNNQAGAVLKRASCNSITIQAPMDDLRIFPLRRINDKPQFGIYVEAGASHVLKGIEFEGILVSGPAGQSIRFYFDNF